MIVAQHTAACLEHHAVEVDGWVQLTGQMPTDPGDPDAPLPDGIEAQTGRVMDNLILVLDGLGLGLADVISARVYLTEFGRDFQAMNEVFASFFPTDPPARTTVRAALAEPGMLVEIEAIAYLG